jgi:glucose/arabinose dehydrogenase
MPLVSRVPLRLTLTLASIIIIAAVSAVVAIAIDRGLDDDDRIVETLGAAVQPTPSAAAEPTARATPLPRDPPVVFEGLPPGYRIESLLTGLDAPAAFDGAPDGRIFYVEQVAGRVRVIEDGVLREEPWYVLPDPHVQRDQTFVSELGLVGITVDPNTRGGTFIYIYYSAGYWTGRRTTKLVRLRDQDGVGVEPVTIFEAEGAPECCHIAGALTWLPDGTLLVGVGDHETPEAAQDLSSPFGKVLRINRDGSAPADNPFAGRPDADPRVYAFGLRNPFGVAAAADDMFVLDNGEFGFDTIHRLTPGTNYGWPSESLDDSVVVAEPLLTYLESQGLAGAILYQDGPLDAFEDTVLFCQFHRGGALHRFDPTPERLQPEDVIVAPGCSSGIRQLADGYVYYLDYVNGALLRITDAAAPPFRRP